MNYAKNELLGNTPLPVDIVLGPSWWNRHEGITFDEDFFFHPARRVEVERKMEKALHDRWGRFGLGADYDKDLPVVGPVHLAAGYLISEMLGCRVDYLEAAAPQVIPADIAELRVSPEAAFESPAFRRFTELTDGLKARHGALLGDVNFAGILNTAIDLRGQTLFIDMIDQPKEVETLLAGIGEVIERFTDKMTRETGTTSISVNRVVRHFPQPIYLHSECSHVMISTSQYEKFLMKYDTAWSEFHRPFGIHYCGEDPHRFARVFAQLPHLDFLDVGWGGDVAVLREHLPDTFLNIRYSPVEIVKQSPDEICDTLRRLVHASGNPYLTGVCCINMDDQVTDEQVTTIFETVESLRNEYGVA
ncbi:MAG TPA: hypothetical protein DD670_11150 [Planctomycetaceae bacterium]|nr:hypothetical protein [Planctomycetaceae bacterium]